MTNPKMSNKDSDEAGNGTTGSPCNEKDNEKDDQMSNPLISELSINSTTVSLDTSLAEVSSILKYLSECDYAQGTNIVEVESECFFGRHYLMQMLATCVQHLNENGENMAVACDHLGKLCRSKQAKNDELAELHGLYQRLIEFSGAEAAQDLDMLKMSIMTKEDALSLSRSGAIVDFKPAEQHLKADGTQSTAV